MLNYKRNTQKLKFLLVVPIVLFFYFGLAISEVTVIEKDFPAPFSGIIIDDESSAKIIIDVQKLPILEDSCRNLQSQVETLKASGSNFNEQIANLNLQIEQYKQLLELEKQRTALYKERSEFYIEQSKAKDKLIEQHQTLEEKLIKEAESKSLWKSLALGELFTIIGIAIGILAL